MQKLHFFKDYLIKKYGHPLYRIPIDLPLGCPNRENNFGQGCIYCAEDGNRARHLQYKLDIKEQVKSGIEFVKRRYNAQAPYIAYFQSFTSTHGEIDQLRSFYKEVLEQADFAMVIIGTRPDCLGNEVVCLLKEIAEKYELWVELGVQTSNDKTLELIRRGHDFKCVQEAVNKLDKAGISCAAHIILGLPGENMDDYRKTAHDISALPFKAVKLHNLLVIKNTPLAKMKVKTLNEYEYAAAASEFLRILSDNIYIMRLNTDAPEKDLIAPKWWMSKGQFLTFFKKYFDSGCSETDFPSIETEDGSFSLYHPKYKQHFHTIAGAKSEAEKKFIEASKLKQALENSENLKLLDIGFGLGYNAIAAIKEAESVQNGKLEIITLENDIQVLKSSVKLFEQNSLHRKILEELMKNAQWQGNFAKIKLITGDARQAVKGLADNFDLIFMDGFSPDKNPELWTYDFIRELCRNLSPQGIIVTYSSAYPVRGALLRCGLNVGETDSFGRKRGGTIASYEQDNIYNPLSDKELAIILKSTAGTAYRDPGLNHKAKYILNQKAGIVNRLKKLGVPKWIKFKS